MAECSSIATGVAKYWKLAHILCSNYKVVSLLIADRWKFFWNNSIVVHSLLFNDFLRQEYPFFIKSGATKTLTTLKVVVLKQPRYSHWRLTSSVTASIVDWGHNASVPFSMLNSYKCNILQTNFGSLSFNFDMCLVTVWPLVPPFRNRLWARPYQMVCMQYAVDRHHHNSTYSLLYVLSLYRHSRCKRENHHRRGFGAFAEKAHGFFFVWEVIVPLRKRLKA